ncbi:nicotinate-nucleotide diphosphorylase [uncultured Corynebacterium sp.]|uniref:nicotinate-nucleotide diphosphorylase n=1 Tax=uncultured Corynebacterium sp. TaxID=159447 RepID=UPI0025E1A4A0|nr:nicotinate-nucleotide diphosphorylase [uncultured Corynebacterium sp.]
MTAFRPLNENNTRGLIRAALREDLAYGPDVTTLATVDADEVSQARFVTRENGVVAALEVIGWVFDVLLENEPTSAPASVAGGAATGTSQAGGAAAGTSHAGAAAADDSEAGPSATETAEAGAAEASDVRVNVLVNDGDRVQAGQTIAEVQAPTRLLLTAERTILNLLTHACGVATETRRWVNAIEGTRAEIRDTRKTLPGMRGLQKYAVRAAGGTNHRMGLGDAAMIKDNHVAAASRRMSSKILAPETSSAADATAGVVEALRAIRAAAPHVPCEVEVDTLDQLDALLALPEPPELILLDNFSVGGTIEAVRRRDEALQGRDIVVKLESSGGLTLDVARSYAEAGVDYLAVGGLTHSVRALDIGLDY